MDSASDTSAHPRRGRKVTIKDVASIAGVSRATVSRVINGTAAVTPDKTAAVLDAIRRTNFQISASAQNLARGRADALAVILTEPANQLLIDPTYATVFQGILEGLAHSNVTPILLTAGSPAEREKMLRLIKSGVADGVIHLSPYTDDTLLIELAMLGIPTVLCGQPNRQPLPTHFSLAYSDDIAASKMAGEYLLSRGSKQVQAILGPADNPATVDRFKGYSESLGSHLLPDVRHVPWTTGAGYFEAVSLLSSGTTFDTVVAGNDRIAAGVLHAVQEAGLRVPQDVRILGFDDHPIAVETSPGISTVRQKFREQGACAVRLAEEMVRGEPGRIEVLETEIVERATT